MIPYQIRLKGHLDRRWEVQFEGFTLTHQFTLNHQPVTVLTGCVADQAALYGLLSRLRDLGLVLISVQPQNED